MEQTITYQLVDSYNDLHVLVNKVNKLLKEGWQLQGGVSISTKTGSTCYVQAMIKIEKV